MMKNKDQSYRTHRFELTKSDAKFALLQFGDSVFVMNGIPWKLSKSMSVGFGNTGLYDNKQQSVMIGAAEFLSSRHDPDDLTFVTIGVSIFHEFRHCQQNLGEDVDKYTAINLISTFGNNCYYLGNWRQMPYEVDAEYFGVVNMWEALRGFDDDETIDKCMLDYINFRSENTAYFLPAVEGGYTSMDQVEAAFQQAYNDSIFGKRDPQPGLSGYPDEFVRLLRADEGIRSPYHEFFDKLASDMTGE